MRFTYRATPAADKARPCRRIVATTEARETDLIRCFIGKREVLITDSLSHIGALPDKLAVVLSGKGGKWCKEIGYTGRDKQPGD